MSWLNIRGKIYHCNKCGATVKVEYEGGSLPTQIGDMNVFQQIALNKKYSTASIKNLLSTEMEYYFHDISGICESCFSNYDTNGSEDILNMLNIIRNSYEEYYGEFQAVINDVLVEYISNLSKDKFKEIDIDSYNNTIGHKYFKLTFKRDKLTEEFITAIREKITNEFKKLLHAEIRLTQILKSYNEKTGELNKSLLKSLRDYKGKFFYEKHIDEVENLNDYIVYQFTVRRPAENTPKLKFYYEAEYPKTSIRKELESFNPNKWCCFDENEFIEKVKGRLRQVI